MNADDQTGLLLRDRLSADTAHLVARPGLAERAARGGRRRIQRRRTTVLATAVVLALLAAVPFTPAFDLIKRTQTPAHPDGGDRYGRLLDRPTQGDLADDQGYRRAVLALWNGRVHGLKNGIGTQVQGEPRVAWAGATPVGPAALVVQLAVLPQRAGVATEDAGRVRTLIGFIGVDASFQPRLVSYDYWRSSTVGDGITGWFVDSARKYLVVRDVGKRLGWSYFGERGGGRLDVEELAFRDGATVARVPDGIDPAQVQLRRLPDDPTVPDVPIAEPVGGPAGTAEAEPLLGWPSAPLFGAGLSRVPDPRAAFAEALTTSGPAGAATGTQEVLATGRISGEEVLIGVVSKGGTGRIFTVLIGSTGSTGSTGWTRVIDGGLVNPDADLPIAIRLPNHRGWAVVRGQAGFSWHAATGKWREGGQFAAVLPEIATRVLITPYFGTGRRVVVPLR